MCVGGGHTARPDPGALLWQERHWEEGVGQEALGSRARRSSGLGRLPEGRREEDPACISQKLKPQQPQGAGDVEGSWVRCCASQGGGRDRTGVVGFWE